MAHPTDFTPAERFWLWSLAVVGFVGLNGAFVYTLLFDPELIRQAMRNPVSAAFIAEALLLVMVLAWLFHRWGTLRVGRGTFVALSLIGGLAFAIPVALLAGARRRTTAL